MSRVVITGSAGGIGSLLMTRLEGHKLTGLDLPECDLRVADLRRPFKRARAVVHLAWDTSRDNWFHKELDPGNMLMGYRVYEAAVAARVRRVVVASSVHADEFRTWDGVAALAVGREPWPDSPYGAGKVMLEALGRYYARHHGLEVVCIRFGGVYPGDEHPDDRSERSVWLSNADCVSLVQHCLDIDRIPGGFELLYGVSERREQVVDVQNAIGWPPS